MKTAKLPKHKVMDKFFCCISALRNLEAEYEKVLEEYGNHDTVEVLMTPLNAIERILNDWDKGNYWGK